MQELAEDARTHGGRFLSGGRVREGEGYFFEPAVVLALAGELGPDLVLLDVCMPGLDGVETARRLSAAYPSSMIVLISTANVEDVAPEFASCGASAFIRKDYFGPAALRRLWSEHGDSSTHALVD